MAQLPFDNGGLIASLAVNQRHVVLNKLESEMKMCNNLDDLEKLMHHMFYNELRVCPDELDGGLLVTEPVFSNNSTREKVIQMLFEVFDVSKLMVIPQEFLVCISYSIVSAIVVNISSAYTSIVPVWELNILRNKAEVLPVGGRDITSCLTTMLQAKPGLRCACDIRNDISDDIKIRHAYVASNFYLELDKDIQTISKTYEMPDGQEFELDKERFVCTECLFQPQLIGIAGHVTGLVTRLRKVLDSLDDTVKSDILKEGIVLAGGSSLLPGLDKRLNKEFPDVIFKAAPERKSSAWIGGSILAELLQKKERKSMWTTKEEYDEYGPSIIHHKCL